RRVSPAPRGSTPGTYRAAARRAPAGAAAPLRQGSGAEERFRPTSRCRSRGAPIRHPVLRAPPRIGAGSGAGARDSGSQSEPRSSRCAPFDLGPFVPSNHQAQLPEKVDLTPERERRPRQAEALAEKAPIHPARESQPRGASGPRPAVEGFPLRIAENPPPEVSPSHALPRHPVIDEDGRVVDDDEAGLEDAPDQV